jgi:hypothetical protein
MERRPAEVTATPHPMKLKHIRRGISRLDEMISYFNEYCIPKGYTRALI